MNPIMRAAREIVVSDAVYAVGYRWNNSLAGGALAHRYQAPRWVTEAAVRAAVAGGLRFGTRRVSIAQMEYLQYVGAHPRRPGLPAQS